jgi:hypothetical protein
MGKMNNFEDFCIMLRKIIYVGQVFDNPGREGTTSTIIEIDTIKIVYQRKKSYISITFKAIYDVYKDFQGKKCSSSELKEYAPEVFNSNARPAGHSCNCTFIFRVFEALGIVVRIEGSGVRGNPFYVNIKKINNENI